MGIDGVIVVDCGCPLRSPGETFRKYQCPDGGGNGSPLQCSCLENPRDGEPGGLPSVGSHRVGQDWRDSSSSSSAQTPSSVIGTSAVEGRALVQFSSVAQSCPTLGDPMNCGTPGLPVRHQLLEFTQTHIHQVSDAIQPKTVLLKVPRCFLFAASVKNYLVWAGPGSTLYHLYKLFSHPLKHRTVTTPLDCYCLNFKPCHPFEFCHLRQLLNLSKN